MGKHVFYECRTKYWLFWALVFVAIQSFAQESFIVKGKIADKENGTGGFGYDPIFVPEGYQVSIASLSPSEKNHISHRYRASIALLNFLKNEKYI